MSSSGSSDGADSSPRIPLAEFNEPLLGARIRARYQPIVRMADRMPVGLEVLARLDHPAHGTLSPEHFVPQMEQAGLAARLTRAVAARAFADYAAHLAPLGLTIALNMPLDVILDPETLPWLAACSAAAGVPPELLVVELTESQPVPDLGTKGFVAFGQAIAGLRRFGCGIAIDDATPAMTGIAEMMALGFTLLKFDKGVTAAAVADPETTGFATALIAASHAAGMRVVAEGVKDPESWERMLALGVDEAQGFLISRPLPAPGVAIWRDSYRSPLT